MLRGQSRKLLKQLLLAHPASEILQNVIDGDPGAFEAGLPTANLGPDLDVVVQSHGDTIGSARKRDKSTRLRWDALNAVHRRPLPLAIGTKTTSLFGAIALAAAGGMTAGTLGALFVVPAMLVGRRRRAPRPAVPTA